MRTLAAFVATMLIAGCAVAPSSDGGIVGTGNRIDCEDLLKKGRSLPDDCKEQRAAPR
jgi:hypothetical protein